MSVFNALDVFAGDAAELAVARERSRILHEAKNVRSSGDEVEGVCRELLARRLPTAYRVTRGHVVDRHGVTSSNFDVIVVDALQMPVLFRADDGNEFVPYESVYAIGEVKTTFDSSKKQVAEFGGKIADLRARLQRADVKSTPQVMFSIDPLNQLFTFMVFADPGDFDPHGTLQQYQPGNVVPCVLAVVERGLIVNYCYKAVASDEEYVRVNVHGPPSALAEETGLKAIGLQDYKNAWGYVEYGAEDDRRASNWLALHFLLMWHLSQCPLTVPDVHEYLTRFLKRSKIARA